MSAELVESQPEAPPVQPGLMPPPKVNSPLASPRSGAQCGANTVDDARRNRPIPLDPPPIKPSPGRMPSVDRHASPPHEPRHRSSSKRVPPAARWIVLVVIVAGLFLRFGLRPIIEHVLPNVLPASFLLPDKPYALDDPQARSRAANGDVDATFPERIDLRPGAPGVVSTVVHLQVPQGKPGSNSRLHVYEPAGSHDAGSLGCVIGTPSGGTYMTGPDQSAIVDEAEWLPYVRAGLAVVVFFQDGEFVGNVDNPTDEEVGRAATKFFAAQAGLVNARHALEFVLARMPEVDSKRIFAAGQDSAATLALLWVEHESRLCGCIAYAPVADAQRHLDWISQMTGTKLTGVMRELLALTSPARHTAKMTCPVFLFHSESDEVVPIDESRAMAAALEQQGKDVQLVTVPAGAHRPSMLDAGLPAAIQWMAEHDQAFEIADRPEPGAAADDAEAPKVARQPSAEMPPGGEGLAGASARWLEFAERLTTELNADAKDMPADPAAVARLRLAAIGLSFQTRTLVATARTLKPPGGQAAIETLTPQLREKITTTNDSLMEWNDRLTATAAGNAGRSELAARIAECLLPDWFIHAQPPAAAEVAEVANVPAQPLPVAPGRPAGARDFRKEALTALRHGREADAVKLLRADLLAADDQALLDEVRWSPALERPAALVEWAFGVELNGFPGTGPQNLLPPSVQGNARGFSADVQLSNQMKSLTGEIGVWIAQGLQARIESQAFGDWGHETPTGVYEHRGVRLLDFAPVDGLIDAARAGGADVLLAVSLTYNRSGSTPSTTMVVRFYNVETGKMLWESKPITSSRIRTARRQGKNIDADYASEVLDYIDNELALRDVPELTGEMVTNRLAVLDANDAADPLETLIELRYLQGKGLVDGAQVRKRLAALLDDDMAARLMSEDRDERHKALAEVAPPTRWP